MTSRMFTITLAVAVAVGSPAAAGGAQKTGEKSGPGCRTAACRRKQEKEKEKEQAERLARQEATKAAAEAARRRAGELVLRGGVDRAAQLLADAAEEHRLPALDLEAAGHLVDAATPVRMDRLEAARERVGTARGLLDALADDAPELLDDTREALRVRCDELAGRLESRRAILARARRGRAELAAGATFVATSMIGFGVMSGGLGIAAARDERLAAIRGQEALYDLTELDAYGRRADTMIAAGAVTGSLLLVLGLGLVAAGAVDRRDYRKSRGAALARLLPGPDGLVLGGRF
jgi:hypothetical protein